MLKKLILTLVLPLPVAAQLVKFEICKLAVARPECQANQSSESD